MAILVKKSAFIIAMLFAVSACNTFEGLGRDIQKAGQHLENAAEKNGAE